ncbi:MAG TPA: hypothetical protein VMU47_12780 [Caldimonas sp.]|nr:hypothetical protein [Caldimonas sp.]
MSAVLTPRTNANASVPPSPAGTAAPEARSAATRTREDDDDHDTGDEVVSAIERLALSRERLRDAMMPRRRVRSGAPSLAEGMGSYASSLVERLRANPGIAVILDAIEEWWAKHPLHTAGVMAAEATGRLAAPIAERRPLTLVFGAVFVGALLALLRPWRWLLRPAVFAGLIPAILLRVLRELPVDTWWHAATAYSRPRDEAAAGDSAGTSLAAQADAPSASRPAPPSPDVQPVRAEPSTVYP